MKIAVASCLAYQDAWQPFLKLFRKFWPDCPYEVLFITDRDTPGQSWCSVVNEFASTVKDPIILLLQEDFFLNAPVNVELICEGMMEMVNRSAAMVRLYPCPGADVEYGHQYFGFIDKRKPYAVSCQATIWRSRVLAEITSHFNTPAEFEIHGSQLAEKFDQPFLAFKRDCKEWPISYLCSAISRGRWNPAAKALCDEHGITNDWSLRPFES